MMYGNWGWMGAMMGSNYGTFGLFGFLTQLLIVVVLVLLVVWLWQMVQRNSKK